MAATNDRTVTVFGGTGFSAAASFGISASASFPFGLHQGIRIGALTIEVADHQAQQACAPDTDALMQSERKTRRSRRCQTTRRRETRFRRTR